MDQTRERKEGTVYVEEPKLVGDVRHTAGRVEDDPCHRSVLVASDGVLALREGRTWTVLDLSKARARDLLASSCNEND